MSDYPRPSPSAPPKPYGPDRVIAITFAILVLLSTILWFAGALRRPDVGNLLNRWWGYYAAYLSALMLYGWVFYGLSKSRLWAFVTTLPLASLSVFGSLTAGNVVRASVALLLIVYSVARAFGLLGPHPLRRLDVLQR